MTDNVMEVKWTLPCGCTIEHGMLADSAKFKDDTLERFFEIASERLRYVLNRQIEEHVCPKD